eukprot:GFYU01004504.1.p1 GENE.GFYU01004504.1~~GFYU01004504.1.p1  ORF type:complete len:330 (-),score=83.71 GFYU01004504.1:52-1041(-)
MVSSTSLLLSLASAATLLHTGHTTVAAAAADVDNWFTTHTSVIPVTDTHTDDSIIPSSSLEWEVDAFLTAESSPKCVGAHPQFDAQCGAITSQDACSHQVACVWTDTEAAACYGSDSNMDAACKQFGSEKECGDQIGCVWRSFSAGTAWMKAIQDSASSLKPASGGSGQYLTGLSSSAVHDVKKTTASGLGALLSAWSQKFGWGADVVNQFNTLLAVESMDFRSFHYVLNGGGASTFLISGGGRNWSGQVEIAFASASATASVDTTAKCNINTGNQFQDILKRMLCLKNPQMQALTAQDQTNINLYMQSQALARLSPELVLLQSDIQSV